MAKKKKGRLWLGIAIFILILIIIGMAVPGSMSQIILASVTGFAVGFGIRVLKKFVFRK